jgi:hypothetical protein
VIVDAVLTPAEVHAGQSVLVDFTLGPGQAKYKPGWNFPAIDLPVTAEAQSGELLPLLPAVYAPGGALPSPAAARAALDADYPHWDHGVPAPALRADAHAYFLLVAPAGQVSITLDLGGSAPWAKEARRTLVIDVLP